MPTAAGPVADLRRALVDACETAGIDYRTMRLLRHFANAVYLVGRPPVIARVAYASGAVDRSTTGLAVARWLTHLGMAVTEPLDRLPSGVDQPIFVDSGPGSATAVTFWRYYQQPVNCPPPNLADLAAIARSIHEIRSTPPINLPVYQPLRNLREALDAAEDCGSFQEDGLTWLRDRVESVVEEYRGLDFPLGAGLIHGDLYNGNLLYAATSATVPVVLGDWDDVCIGPREVDLVPTFTSVRFGLDTNSLERFVKSYGYDLRKWPGYWTLRTLRELSTLTALVRLAPTTPTLARELEHRLATLQAGDYTTHWNRQ